MGCGLGSLRSSSRYSSLTRLARLLLHPSEHPPTAGVGLFSFLNAENPQDLLVLGASYVKPAATYSHRAPLCPGTHIAAGGRWAADSLRCEVAVLLLTQLALPAYSCSTIRAVELNGRVRDGNGCSLYAIVTDKLTDR